MDKISSEYFNCLRMEHLQLHTISFSHEIKNTTEKEKKKEIKIRKILTAQGESCESQQIGYIFTQGKYSQLTNHQPKI